MPKAQIAKSINMADFGGPVRFKTAFFMYSDSVRNGIVEKLKAKGPLKVADVGKQIGGMWKSLSPAEKEKWEDKGKKNKDEYDAALEKFKQSPRYAEFEAAKGDLSDAKAKKKEKNAKKDLEKEMQEAGKPKKPQSSYMLFSGSVRDDTIEKLKAKGPLKVADVGKQIGEMWKSLVPSEKAKWEDKAKADKAKYETDLAAWEASDVAKQFQEPAMKKRKVQGSGSSSSKDE